MGAEHGRAMGEDSDDAAYDALCMQNRLRALGAPRKETKEEVLKYHRWSTKRRIKHEAMIASGRYVFVPLKIDCMPGFATGIGWRNHRPPKDIDKLRTIRVPDLRLGEVHKGCVVWGTLSEQPMACGEDHAVYTIMTDLTDSDSIVKVSFHSEVKSTTCEEAALEFPVGAHIGIQEPLFKVYKDGTTGIRVDNMQHVFGQVGSGPNDSMHSRTRWDPPRSNSNAPENPDADIRCQHCGSQPPEGKKLKSCAGCLNASYCGSACQKADWPRHKVTCGESRKATANDDPTEDLPNMFTKGLYCKDNDFKVASKGLSIVPDSNFCWAKSIWAISPPRISEDARTVTNQQFETTFCSSSPFGGNVTMCHVKVLGPPANLVSLGLCLVRKGKIDKTWKFSSDGTKCCGNGVQPYGEPFGIEDVMTVCLKKGELSFQKNGRDLGVCFSGFSEDRPQYYLRGYLCAGMQNGFPLPGKVNGGSMEIFHLPTEIAMHIVPGRVVTISGLQARDNLNGQAARILRLLPSGRVAVRLCGNQIELAVKPQNLTVTSNTEDGADQSKTDPKNPTENFHSHACSEGGVVSAFEAQQRGCPSVACRTCSNLLSRSSFSKRSWKNYKGTGAQPQCQSCAARGAIEVETSS